MEKAALGSRVPDRRLGDVTIVWSPSRCPERERTSAFISRNS